MKDNKAHFLRQQIIDLRQKLSELEAKRSKSHDKEAPKIWDSFMGINVQLSVFEQKLIKINDDILKDIQQHREAIIAKLDEYNQLAQSMREMEKLFLVFILRPGFVLKQATRQRTYLEKEYRRIRSGIINHQFDTLQEVESEIQKIILHSDNAYDSDERNFKDEQIEEHLISDFLEAYETDDIAEDVNESQIVDDFKRVVLRAVHPDTSDTPKETFLTAMTAYKNRDYLLMEAYVAQYEGEFEVDQTQELLSVHDMLINRQRNFHRLFERLIRRLKVIKKELDPIELENPQAIKDNLKAKQDELKNAIKLETEKIFELRLKIEALTQFYIEVDKKHDQQ